MRRAARGVERGGGVAAMLLGLAAGAGGCGGASVSDAVTDGGIAQGLGGHPGVAEGGGSTECTAPGTLACGSGCVDPQNDPENCGACGVVCPEGDVCAQGACSLYCAGGSTRCGSQCVDLRDDPINCGGCGVLCGIDEACVNAQCAPLALAVTDAGGTAPVDASGGTTAADGSNGAPETGGSPLDSGTAPGDDASAEDDAEPGDDAALQEDASAADAEPVSLTSNWRMVGHDAQHSGNNSNEIGVAPPVAEWSLSLMSGGAENDTDEAMFPAVVENGRAFVGYGTYFDQSTPLVAVDVATGTELWTYNFGYVDTAGQPTVWNGNVYIQTIGTDENCYLWAFDAVTGNVNWTASFASQWVHFWSPMVQGNTVYINGGEYGGMYGFSVVDGTQLFFNDSLGQYDSWSPAYFGGAVYSFVDGIFQASDPTTGAAIWSTTINWNWDGYSMNTSPVFGSSLAYVISPPNLVAIDPSAHAVSWTDNGAFTGMPAVASGVVYAINAGSLVARDATTGTLVWTFVGDQNLSYPPAIANGYVYVASESNVYAVSIATHQQVWTAAVGGWVTVAAGRLLVSGTDGSLHGYVLAPP